jgi:hypothetical protein
VKKRKRETYEDVGTGTLEEGSDTLSLDDLATSVAVEEKERSTTGRKEERKTRTNSMPL